MRFSFCLRNSFLCGGLKPAVCQNLLIDCHHPAKTGFPHMGLVDRVVIGAVELAAETSLGKAAIAAAETAAKEVFGTEGGQIAQKVLGKLESKGGLMDSLLPNMSVANTERPLYKVLVDGRSPWLPEGGQFPLPKKTDAGWIPGEWVEHTSNPRMAEIVNKKLLLEQSTLAPDSANTAGLYVTSDPQAWVSPSIWANAERGVAPVVYEVEVDAASAQRFNEALNGLNKLKPDDFAAARIRLLRPIEEGPYSADAVIQSDIEALDAVLDDFLAQGATGAPVKNITSKLMPLHRSHVLLTDDINAGFTLR
jgi:hypothetical protein